MICKVIRAVEKYRMPIDSKRVVVALSGGADSMALLNVLYTLREQFSIELEACHVNHSIRGEDADSDEAFVKAECEKLGIKLHVLHADVPTLAKQQGIGLEECGRQVRYEYFSSLGDCIIATAHTLSDRCETLLMNIARGTSSKGLCSIPPVRGNIVRPLIDCTRDDIEAYCRENGISYVTDKTNFDPTYSRNRIRLNIIPEMKKLNPSFEGAVLRLTQSVADDEEYFNSVVDDVLNRAKTEKGIDARVISDCPTAVRYRAIARLLTSEAGITPERIHIKMVDSVLGGGKTEIIGDTVVETKNGIIYINPEKEIISEWELDFSEFSALTPNGRICAQIINKSDLPPKQIVHNKVIDFESIVGKCVIRNRRAGDKMRLAGSSCTKTLKKLFNEKHLENRNSLLIIADESGILWVQNLGCADRCKIKQETQKILLIGEEQKND